MFTVGAAADSPQENTPGRDRGLSAAAASWLLRLAMRDARLVLNNGGRPTAEMRAAMQWLADRADVELLTDGSASRTESASVSEFGWVTVAYAADLVHRSESYLQRLARQGRVRHRRIGARTYELHLESLQTFLRRTG